MRLTYHTLYCVMALTAAAAGQDLDTADDGGQYYYYYHVSNPETLPNDPKPAMKPDTIIDHEAEGGNGKVGGCTDDYPATNTMCIAQDDPDVIEYGYSPDDIQLIVDYHNEKRAEVRAKNMVKMYWDPELAITAQKMAQSCSKNHDANKARVSPKYAFLLGQNYCGGVDLKNCMRLWYEEINVFTYGDAAANAGKKIGHYTMMVNHKAIGIGCGYADCWGKQRHNIYCNYAYGQTPNAIQNPYIQGRKGRMCRDFKDEQKLCDVGHNYCQNMGKMNVKTGKCVCVAPFGGDDCTVPDCSQPDQSNCNTGNYVPENCFRYRKILYNICSRMCGICPEE